MKLPGKGFSMDQYKRDILLSLVGFILTFASFIYSLGDDRMLARVLLGAASCFALFALLRDIRAQRKADC